MPRFSWAKMMREHPSAHLVVGRLPESKRKGRATDRKAAHREQLVGELAAALQLEGPWSASAVREKSGEANLHLAFASARDAGRFADAVMARPVGRYPGWASQREFGLTPAVERSIAAALATSGEIDER